MAKIAIYVLTALAALLAIVMMAWGAVALNSMPITGILTMGTGSIGLMFVLFVANHLLPRKEVKMDPISFTGYEIQPIQQDLALSEYRKDPRVCTGDDADRAPVWSVVRIDLPVALVGQDGIAVLAHLAPHEWGAGGLVPDRPLVGLKHLPVLLRDGD